MNVNAVADQLRPGLLILRRRADHARFPVGEWRHRIIQMRHMMRPRLHRRFGRLIIGTGVGYGKAEIASALTDTIHRTLCFRRNRHHADHAFGRLLEPLKHPSVRRSDISRILRTLFLLGNKRPFQINTPQNIL